MKKILIIACIAICVILLLLPLIQRLTYQNLYPIVVIDIIEHEPFLRDYEFCDVNAYTAESPDSSMKRTFQIGETTVSATPVEIRRYAHKEDCHVYLSGDKSIEYTVYPESGSFSITAQNDTVLSAYTGAALTEEALLNHAKTYLHSIDSRIDFNSYTYSYESAYNTITFREFCNGIATADLIRVNCDASGNIDGVAYYELGLDWGSVTVDSERVDDTVAAFLYDHATRHVESYDISSQSLTYVDGKIQLSVTVEVYHSKDGSDTSSFKALLDLS